MIELKASNIHWLENTEAERDLCAHSSVYLKIGDKILSDDSSGDWTVSSSAYHLLKTLKEDHSGKAEPQLIECCGYSMYVVGKNHDELYIIGCANGINWTTIHKENKIVHQFEDGEIIETDFDEWRNAICNFSDEIMNFYKVSSPKILEDDEEVRRGFELFMREWKKLREEAFD